MPWPHWSALAFHSLTRSATSPGPSAATHPQADPAGDSIISQLNADWIHNLPIRKGAVTDDLHPAAAVELPRPLPALNRRWCQAKVSEDRLASLSALEHAIPSQ